MKPDNRFLTWPGYFWAYVMTISENVGYTVRKKGLIKVPTLSEITVAPNKLGLSTDRVASDDHQLTELGRPCQITSSIEQTSSITMWNLV